MVDPNMINAVAALVTEVGGSTMRSQSLEAQAAAIRVSGSMQATGMIMSAEALKQSAKNLEQIGMFNQSVADINSKRRLEASSRQYERTLGSQMTGAAASGINLNSKSFLQVRNETLDNYARDTLNLKLDAENERRASAFETRMGLTNLYNNQKAAEYQAEVAKVTAENKARAAEFSSTQEKTSTVGKVFKALPTLASMVGDLGGLGSLFGGSDHPTTGTGHGG